MFQYQKPNFNFLAALQSLSSGLPIVLHTVLTVSQVFPSSSSTSGIILASSLQRCSDNRLVGCSFIFLSGAVMITSLLLRSAADRHCLYLISFGFHAFEHVRTSLFSDKIIFTFITTMTYEESEASPSLGWQFFLLLASCSFSFVALHKEINAWMSPAVPRYLGFLDSDRYRSQNMYLISMTNCATVH